ncbi:MAG: RnfABCDGE type electron transport complex subunit G [Bacteroidales bacterium]|nr:RnfABCDGE type electron transport complex subunit G [Bacteroidales bacterium]HQP03726.1 RnfABCDGE type electron transport complex subunit G [Bacteroidales bacterium]
MAKKESSFKNMVLTLSLIASVAAVALGFVYKYTVDPIAQVKKEELKKSINLVVPGADKGKIVEVAVKPDDGVDSLYFYEVNIGDKRIATAVKSYTDNGFSGRFTIMVGFDTAGNIIDNNVLEHKETPGLGDKTSKSKSTWNEQFKGKNPGVFKLKVKKDGGDVDAITAATISSRAYCDALQRAFNAYQKHYNLNPNAAQGEQNNGGNNQ